MSFLKKLKEKEEKEEIIKNAKNLDSIIDSYESPKIAENTTDYIQVKPKRKTTEHEDKSFKVNRTLNKSQLISKVFEIAEIHKDEIPIEFFRNLLLQIDLTSHRRQLKK